MISNNIEVKHLKGNLMDFLKIIYAIETIRKEIRFMKSNILGGLFNSEKTVFSMEEIEIMCTEVLSYLNSQMKIIELIKGKTMDKQIKKIKFSIDNAEKDTKKLLKMDKKQDKKINKAEKILRKKK